MHMRIFTLILTAMLTVGAYAQSFADYSSLVGKSYNELSRQYPNMEEMFAGFYSIEINDGKTTSLLLAFNDDTEAYMVMQGLQEDAYTLAQIIAYMDSKYKKYPPETEEFVDEETGETVTTTTYYYGNTADPGEATLIISFADNTAIAYTNPQAIPDEPESVGLGEMTPLEVTTAFLGKSLDDIEDLYPGVFADIYGIGLYSAMGSEDNEMLEGAVLLLDENNVAAGLRLLYASTDDGVIAYYKENGYTCTENGTTEEGEKMYTITNGTYTIAYAGGTGTVTVADPTGIANAKQTVSQSAWYTLKGAQLGGKPTKKGLYINGNRKVMVK